MYVLVFNGTHMYMHMYMYLQVVVVKYIEQSIVYLLCVCLQEYAKIIEDITYHELLILETLGESMCTIWNVVGFI